MLPAVIRGPFVGTLKFPLPHVEDRCSCLAVEVACPDLLLLRGTYGRQEVTDGAEPRGAKDGCSFVPVFT